MRDKVTGKPMVFGFVAFDNLADLDAVLMDKHTTDGRMMKIFKVDDHIDVAIAGLTLDGRVLSRYLCNDCINHRFVYESDLTVGRLVVQLTNKVQVLEVEVNGVKQKKWSTYKKVQHFISRYLDNIGCVGQCVNMCKIPTQDFFTNEFGLPLTMTPNFEDMSCDMIYGQVLPPFEEDPAVANQSCYANILTTPEKSHKSKSSKLAIMLSLISGVLLLAFIGCFLWRRKKRSRAMLGVTASFEDTSNGGAGEDDLDLPLFDFGTIAASTNHFSEESKLGEGGFGPVYKGKLEDTQDIAVKRLARTSVQGCEEFKNEMVLIAKLQHRNLVRLLGCCIQGEERMLIYEYMPNKSLDAFLFDKEKAALLDWQTRYNIILGITRGLLYLHQDSRFRIIHRDLKASNILLDKDMNPKISDFGMARIFGGDETDFNTKKVVGTYGYMSPEYAMDGIFSVKSDVFSFGVLVLEIVSGKKNRGVYSNSSHINLLSHAWSLWKEGKSMQVVDDLMSYSFSMDEVIRCIKLGLLCVQERPEDRPLMSSVILMLSSDIASMPQPKQAGFAVRSGPFETESSSSKKDPSEANDITITVLTGR